MLPISSNKNIQRSYLLPGKITAQSSLDSPKNKKKHQKTKNKKQNPQYDISDSSFPKLKFILSASFVSQNKPWLTDNST